MPIGPAPPLHPAARRDPHFIPLEDVMVGTDLDLLFPGMEIDACELFRVTRNANTETRRGGSRRPDGADRVASCSERRFAPIVRLEVGSGMAVRASRHARRGARASTSANDVFEVTGMLAMRDLLSCPSFETRAARYPTHHPSITSAVCEATRRNIFHIMRDAARCCCASVRVVRHLGRALPAGGGRGPEGARDQDDAVPDLERRARS